MMVRDFPGPVATATKIPEGYVALPGYESKDSRPWSMQVSYEQYGETGKRLVVRTTRGSLDWTPVIGTVENLRTVMANCACDVEESVPATTCVVEFDGVGVEGVRLSARRGRCGIEFSWKGQHVYVVGDEELVEPLALRTATDADFEAYVAEHLRRHRPR
jgi:hypothetical protein